MKYLFFIILSFVMSSVLYVYGKDNINPTKHEETVSKDTIYLMDHNKIELDTSNNIFYVTKYRDTSPMPQPYNYTLPYVDLVNNQAIGDSSKWFPAMLDIFDILDSLSHEKRPDMFIWRFYPIINKPDHFEIYEDGFDYAHDDYKDQMYGGFILNGKAFIIVMDDSLKHRREIENIFVKRPDSIRINIVYEYLPNLGFWFFDIVSEVLGMYQNSILLPYKYIHDSKQTYFLNDSVSKYYGAQK